MYSNHHAKRLVSLEREIININANSQTLRADLDWFERFELESNHTRLAQVQRETLAAREQLARVEQSIKACRAELNSAKGVAEAGWSPLHWFSTERRVAERQVSTLQKRLSQFKSQQEGLVSGLGESQREELRLNANSQRYRGFDSLQANATITQLEHDVQRLQGVADEVRKASAHWEAVAGEVYRNWKTTHDQLRATEQDIIDAECFINQLDNAQSSFDKKMVHDDCEDRFGAGQRSPDRVLKDRQFHQRKLKREEEKRMRRLRDTIRLLENEIRALVIDGNNLCYLNEAGGKRRFIGLAVLKALVPHLAATYGVTLVFDPGIRCQLDMSDNALQAMFPQVRVLVMPPTLTADHPVLAAAEFDVETYVISNDHYSDYPDMAAVREERVLHAVVHRDSVQIPQLQILLPH
ncbi:hypothetical protein PS865_04363 [Pseudomonas fluorescens]|uniref:hypothetical protein n=1 Tax=Pseudomonas fluorescens TaxID=294 RepID=UPI00124298E4|nr:hypothetical protein [Pseudomonas fluorescens]VVP31068.1 hypothetical protein PS865_04363 [Pseudomonas fluorescens]